MASDNQKTPRQKPLGQNIRDLVNAALEDSRRMEFQKEYLDRTFGQMLGVMETKLGSDYKKVFNMAANEDKKQAGKGNILVLNLLTTPDMYGNPSYNPAPRFGINIATPFLAFAADDIKELPNYIKLHELARELDIAIKVTGLLIEDAKGPNGAMPAHIVFDASKSYDDGALENGQLYPNLPPPKAKFDPQQGQSFDLD